MGDVPYPVDEELTRAEKAEATAREVIAGHPEAAVRRIILYAILGAGVVLGGGLGAIISFTCLTLLLATDQLL